MAALLIVGTHAAYGPGKLSNGYLGTLCARLEVGVPIFFALSGFLLFRPWVRAGATRTPPPSLAVMHFVARDASRSHTSSWFWSPTRCANSVTPAWLLRWGECLLALDLLRAGPVFKLTHYPGASLTDFASAFPPVTGQPNESPTAGDAPKTRRIARTRMRPPR